MTNAAVSSTSGPATHTPILEIDGLEQRLCDRERHEEFVVHVNQPVVICDGDFVALLGPSGCGKTTLLTVLGLLRRPTNVETLRRFAVWIGEGDQRREIDLKEAWMRRRRKHIERARRRHMGFALQTGELLPALTVRENIAVPLQLNGLRWSQCCKRVDELINSFNLQRVRPAGAAIEEYGESPPTHNGLADSRVNRLSGGEYQRVSLARAIAHRPDLVFVDEPTAALNRELAREALVQLQRLQEGRTDVGATLMITHDEELAKEFANVTIRMAPLHDRAAGEIVDIVRSEPDEGADEEVPGATTLCPGSEDP